MSRNYDAIFSKADSMASKYTARYSSYSEQKKKREEEEKARLEQQKQVTAQAQMTPAERYAQERALSTSPNRKLNAMELRLDSGTSVKTARGQERAAQLDAILDEDDNKPKKTISMNKNGALVVKNNTNTKYNDLVSEYKKNRTQEQFEKDLRERRRERNQIDNQAFYDEWGAKYNNLSETDRKAFDTIVENEGHSAVDKAIGNLKSETRDARKSVERRYSPEEIEAYSRIAKEKNEYETYKNQEAAYKDVQDKLSRMSSEEKDILPSLSLRSSNGVQDKLKEDKINELKNKYGLSDDEITILSIIQRHEQNKIDHEEYETLLRPFIKDHPWLSLAVGSANFMTAPFNAVGMLNDISDAAKLEKLGYKGKTDLQGSNNPLSAASNLNSIISEENGDRLNGWYNTIMQSVNNIAVNTLLPGGVGFAAFGLGAAPEGIDTARENGADWKHQLATGAAYGANEAIWEKVSWGNIGKIEQFTGGIVKGGNVLSRAVNWLSRRLVDSGLNGLEEVNTDLANDVADYLINGDYSKYGLMANTLKDQGYSRDEITNAIAKDVADNYWKTFREGAKQGFLMGGVNSAMQARSDAQSGRALRLGEYSPENITDKLVQNGYSADVARSLANDIVDVAINGDNSTAQARISMNDMDGVLFNLVNEARDAVKRNTEVINRSAQEMGIAPQGETNIGVSRVSRLAADKVARNMEVKRSDIYNQFREKGASGLESAVKAYKATKLNEKVSNWDFGKMSRQEREDYLNKGELSSAINQATEQKATENSSDLASLAKMRETVENTKQRVSTTGETSLANTGETIKSYKVTGIERSVELNKENVTSDEFADIKIEVTLDNGKTKTVSPTDINYSSNSTAKAIDVLSTVATATDIDTETANFILNSVPLISNDYSASTIATAMQTAYDYGKYNLPVGVYGQTSVGILGENMFNAIKKFGENNLDVETTGLVQSIAKAAAMGGNRKGAATFRGKEITTESIDNDNSLSDVQKDSLRSVLFMAEASGLKIAAFESTEAQRKAGTANGQFEGDVLTVDINAGKNGTMMFTLAHELTHFIKKWSPAQFNNLAKFVMKRYGEKGVNVESLIQHEINLSAKRNHKLSRAAAYEEVVCNAMESMLTDDHNTVVNHLVELNKENPELYKKMKGEVDRIGDAVSKKYKEHIENGELTKPGKYIADLKDELDELRKMFAEALQEAGENYRKSGAVESEGRFQERISNEEIINNSIKLQSMEVIKNLTGNEFEKKEGVTLRERLQDYFESLGNVIHTDNLGDVQLTNSSIHSEIRHGLTRDKIVSFAAIPEVLKKGVIIDQLNKTDDVVRIVVAAPITIKKEKYYMGVMLQSDKKRQRLYLHDVIAEKEATLLSTDNSNTYEVGKSNNSFFISNILQKALNVKTEGKFQDREPIEDAEKLDREYFDAIEKYGAESQQVKDMAREAAEKAFPNSKVRDGASVHAYPYGRLLPVFHGRVSEFRIFERRFGNAEGDFGRAFYFTNNKDDVEQNYASEEGADLKQKMGRLRDRLEYDDKFQGLSPEEQDKYIRDQYIKTEPNIVTAYLNIENPVYIIPDTVYISNPARSNGTYFDYEQEYDEENDEFGEPEGKLVDFVNALEEAAEEYWQGSGSPDFSFLLYDSEGMFAADAVDKLKDRYDYIDYLLTEDGDYALPEVIRSAFEIMGYDGIIDSSVGYKFRRMNGMTKDTVHYLAFNSNQIKRADPVTYDESGNVIPLSERFSKSNDINYQERDQEYFDALERYGEDSKEVAELVEQAAEDAYSIKKTRNMSWQEQIKGLYANDGTIKHSDTLVLSNNPSLDLLNEGVTDKPLAVPLKVISKAQNGSNSDHTVTNDNIARIDKGIKNAPALIIDKDNGYFAYITDIVQDGKPLFISFKQDASFDNDDVHQATSVHLRSDIASTLKNLPDSATVIVRNKNALDKLLGTSNILAEGLTADIKYGLNTTTPSAKSQEDIHKIINQPEMGGDTGNTYSTIKDKSLIKKLDEQETVKTYRAMALIDGKLYPPMATIVDGKMVEGVSPGEWVQADEHPELIKIVNGKPKFTLDKGKLNGKSTAKVDAAYNPYMHSSNVVLNDQFSIAYQRPNLVTVECEVPVSEVKGNYKAQYAKDSTGWHDWKSGAVASQLKGKKDINRQVLLSRWLKPVRIMPDSEVAQLYKSYLDGTDVAVPDNVVSPRLLAELKKIGVNIKESGKVKSQQENTFSEKREDFDYYEGGKGNGYSGYSMSNNAVEAYKNGEKPMSKWTKAAILERAEEISPEKAKLLRIIPVGALRSHLLIYTAWHHTSSQYNKTDFYAVDEDALEELTPELASKWAKEKESKAPVKSYKGDMDYIEWTGSKKYPKAVEKHLKNVTIEERGSFYVALDENGNEIVRKKIGSNGTIVTESAKKAKLEEEMKKAAENNKKSMIEKSSPAALKLYDKLVAEGYDSSRSAMYEKGRKPNSWDYDIGLEKFFKVGEQRLLMNDGYSPKNGVTLQEWNGTEWIDEKEDINYSTKTYDDDGNIIPPSQRFNEGEKVFGYQERSTMTNEQVDKATESLYTYLTDNRASTNNDSINKWVFNKRIFSKAEIANFEQQASNLSRNKDKFESIKTPYGDYMLIVENKIVYTDGDEDNPYISEILEVATQYGKDVEWLRKVLIENAKRLQSSNGIHGSAYRDFIREKFVIRYRAGDSRPSDLKTGKGLGSNRETALQNCIRKQYRAGNIAENQGNELIRFYEERSTENGGALSDAKLQEREAPEERELPYFLDKQEQDEVFAILEEMNRARDEIFNGGELSDDEEFWNAETVPENRIGGVRVLNKGQRQRIKKESVYQLIRRYKKKFADKGTPFSLENVDKATDMLQKLYEDMQNDRTIAWDEAYERARKVAIEIVKYTNWYDEIVHPGKNYERRIRQRRFNPYGRLQDDEGNDTSKGENFLVEDETLLTPIINDILTDYFDIPVSNAQAVQKASVKANYENKIGELKRQLKEIEKEHKELVKDKTNAERRALIEQRRNERYHETVEKRNQKAQIKKVADSITKKLTTNGDQSAKHIPESLKKSVLNFAEIINEAGVFDSEKRGKLSRSLASISKALERNSDADDSGNSNMMSMYDEEMKDAVSELAERIGENKLSELSSSELKEIKELTRYIRHIIVNANKAFSADIKESISDMGQTAYDEIISKKPSKIFYWGMQTGMLKPVTFFDMLGSKTLSRLYENIREGELKWYRVIEEAKQFRIDAQKQFNYDEWKDQTVIVPVRDESVEMPMEEALALYATITRSNEQGAKHLLQGGFSTKNVKDKRMTADDMVSFIGSLTNDQKGYVEAMIEYLSKDMASLGNEVTMKLYGIRKFLEDHYFPLSSDPNSLYEDGSGTLGNVDNRIKHFSMTKALTKNANNPLAIGNFTDTCMRHCSDMGLYYGLCLPMEDFNRVYNYKGAMPSEDQGGTQINIKKAIEKAFPSHQDKKNKNNPDVNYAQSYISTLRADINGKAGRDSARDMVKKMISLSKKGAVFASASVAIQQPSAVGRAFRYINPKYFIKTTFTKRDYEECKKWCAVAGIKEMGFFDTGVGRSATEWMTQGEYATLKEKGKAIFTDRAYRDELLSKLPSVMDEITWSHIWNACKEEIKDTTDLKEGSDEFYNAAAERFTFVIDRTQVYDSVFSRSEFMRSKDSGAQVMTAFMAEPTTALNMLYSASFGTLYNGETRKQAVGKATGAFLTSVVLNSLLKSLVTAARRAGKDDEEEKSLLEIYVEEFFKNGMDDGILINYIPYIKDLYSAFQGYDSERMDTTAITKVVDAVKAAEKDGFSYKSVKAIAGAVGLLTGVPVSNVWRDMEAATSIGERMIDTIQGEARKTTTEGIGEAIKSGINPFPSSTSPVKKNSVKMVKQYLKGDMESYRKTRESLKGENASTVKSHISAYLRENYVAGKLTDFEVRQVLTYVYGMAPSNISKKLEEFRQRKNGTYETKESKKWGEE